ncbi:DUF2007 domain-containing protein [Galbibacter sp. EGI 63066]|uniref:putative signal transducing protein n=1 Tax=Galbibacter sp. EGI 63066 TaxID=2993559 RepID=UPI002248C0FE|nr:DUF2007 domain-containing protein [Galbibacter sp. EGI 63066]MCX2680831.1 DUF2007 domain-containing protein [Galbibacter sp. EGI 63066]
METQDYIRIFTGERTYAALLESRLKDVSINPIIKNESESARLAGFAPAVFNQVQVFVHKDEHEKALKVLTEVEKEVGEKE